MIEENYTPVFRYKFFFVWLFLNDAVKLNYKERRVQDFNNCIKGVLGPLPAPSSRGVNPQPPLRPVPVLQEAGCGGSF